MSGGTSPPVSSSLQLPPLGYTLPRIEQRKCLVVGRRAKWQLRLISFAVLHIYWFVQVSLGLKVYSVFKLAWIAWLQRRGASRIFSAWVTDRLSLIDALRRNAIAFAHTSLKLAPQYCSSLRRAHSFYVSKL